MKRRHVLTVISLVLLHVSASPAQQFNYTPSPEFPVVSAHRGGWAPGYVENSLVSFQRTHEKVADAWIEIDVAMSADSALFLLHDNTLDRTTSDTGAFADHRWDLFRWARLVDITGDTMDYGFTTFNEALIWARGRTVLVIDPKPTASPTRIAAAIDSAGMSQDVVVITNGVDNALAYHRANPQLTLQISLNSPTADSRFAVYERAGIPRNRLTAVVRGYERDEAEEYVDLFRRLRRRGIWATLLVFHVDDDAARDGYGAYVPYLEDGAKVLATNRVELANMAVRTYRASHR